jgi:hypothetical protein
MRECINGSIQKSVKIPVLPQNVELGDMHSASEEVWYFCQEAIIGLFAK